MTTYEIHVDGMTCLHCVGAVRGAVVELPGVEDVQVSLEEKKATVRVDENGASLEQIKAAIEEEGYAPL